MCRLPACTSSPSGNGLHRPGGRLPAGITISDNQLTLLQGTAYTLTTAVYPWTLQDKSVTWTTSDESVVRVDGGRILAQGLGQAVITVTTHAAPNLTASCTVTVEKLSPVSLSGLVYDKSGSATGRNSAQMIRPPRRPHRTRLEATTAARCWTTGFMPTTVRISMKLIQIPSKPRAWELCRRPGLGPMLHRRRRWRGLTSAGSLACRQRAPRWRC